MKRAVCWLFLIVVIGFAVLVWQLGRKSDAVSAKVGGMFGRDCAGISAKPESRVARVFCADRAYALHRIEKDAGETVPFLLAVASPMAVKTVLATYPTVQLREQSSRILACDVPKSLARQWLSEGIALAGVTAFEVAAPLELYGSVATGERFTGTAPLQYNSRLDGRSEVVAVIDTGISTGKAATFHPELLPALYGMTVEPSLSAAVSVASPEDTHSFSHGTHVAGCVVASGAYYSSLRGSAPGAALFFHRIANGGSLYLFSDITSHFERSVAVGATVINCSWGHSTKPMVPGYNLYSRLLDDFVWNYPEVLICVAVGNDGVDADGNNVVDLKTVYSQEALAKNALVVGAQESYRPTVNLMNKQFTSATFNGSELANDLVAAPYDGEHDGMFALSSRGPLYDGRIVPMLVAPGSRIVSTLKDGSYGFSDGTSMATPIVSGAAAVMRQYLREVQALSAPTAAAVRAGLILASESLSPGQFGTGAMREIPETSPNSVEGWGALRLGKLLQGGDSGKAQIGVYDRIVLEKSGGETSFEIPDVRANTRLSVVLSWIDAPSAVTTGVAALINDYDLSLRSPSGVEYAVDDHLNTIEKLQVSVGEDSGTWQVIVSAKQIRKTGTGNLAAVVWTAETDNADIALPKDDKTLPVTLEVKLPEGVQPYVEYPVWPAPGAHTYYKGSPCFVRAGAWLPWTASGKTRQLSRWIQRTGAGDLLQGVSDSFLLNPEAEHTLQWYERFPGAAFRLR